MLVYDESKENVIEAKDFVYELFKNIDDELFDELMASFKKNPLWTYYDIMFKGYVRNYNSGKCGIEKEFESARIIDEKLNLSTQSVAVCDLIRNFSGLYKVLSLCDLTEFINSEEKDRIMLMNPTELKDVIKNTVIKEIFLLMLENSSVKKRETHKYNDDVCDYMEYTFYDLHVDNNLDEIKDIFKRAFKEFDIFAYDSIRAYVKDYTFDSIYNEDEFFFDEVMPDCDYFLTSERLLDML